MAGVPVYAERGAGGGWVLPDSFRTDVTGLTESEIQALFVTHAGAAAGGSRAGAGVRRGAGQAAGLAASGCAPRCRAGAPAHPRRRGRLASVRRNRPALAALQEAVWLDRKVRSAIGAATARPSSGSSIRWGWWPKAGSGISWPPWTASLGRTGCRGCRLSDRSDEPATRPPTSIWRHSGRSLSAELVANLPRYPIIVRVAPEAVRRLWIPGAYARVEQVGEPEAGRLAARSSWCFRPRPRRAATCSASGPDGGGRAAGAAGASDSGGRRDRCVLRAD